ncbi:MAG: hypothetical protein M3347_16140, partial [Armatimonadota bacterium]|nr:hypothetical protein [Armatimonadota bacterium]
MLIGVHRWFTILGIAAASRAGMAQPLQIDQTSFQDAERDAAGQIWAIQGSADGLYRWDDSGWDQVDVSAITTGAEPLNLIPSPNGALICLWYRRNEQISQTEPQEFLLTEHKGKTSRLLTKFKAKIDYSQRFMFADRAGNVWITSGGKGIYRITPAGAAERIYSIAPFQMRRLGNPADYSGDTNSLHAIEDGRGRLWFWSHVWDHGTEAYSLPGVLIFDGHRFRHHRTLTGVATKPTSAINALAPKDAGHLWLAMGDDGLYEVDIATLHARRVPEPEPKAFRYVQQITRLGRDWYFVTGSRWIKSCGEDSTERNGTLWSRRDGRWHKLLAGLEHSGDATPRPLLPTAEGLWVGTFDDGMWYLSNRAGNRGGNRDGAKHLINWRRGFPLNEVHHLFMLSGGRVLALSPAGNVTLAGISSLVSLRPSPRVRTFRPYTFIRQDAHGHLWCVLSLRSKALSQWDGTRWLHHPVPRNYKPNNVYELALDSRQRVWLLPDNRQGPTVIFHPAKNVWQTFATYPAALQAQLKPTRSKPVVPIDNPGPAWSDRNVYMVPRVSHDGRLCFRSVFPRVWYFDGKIWRKWTRREITRDLKSDWHEFDDPPFFNRADNLCVNIASKTWEWTPSRGWHTIPEESGLNSDHPDATDVQARSQCGLEDYDSRLRDRTGAVWILARHQLYKVAFGLCAPQFASGEIHPFIDGRSISRIFVDPRGNTFFDAAYVNVEYVFLAAHAVPDTQLKIIPRSVDSITLEFAITAKGDKTAEPYWFHWRQNGGPWIAPLHNQRVPLDFLAPGAHR